MKRRVLTYVVLLMASYVGITACQEEVGLNTDTIHRHNSFRLTYVIPKLETLTRVGDIPSANLDENKVNSLQLLFFEFDTHNNGKFLGTLEGRVKGNSLENIGNVTINFEDKGILNNDTDYNVLVIANADSYNLNKDTLQSFCTGKTENEVKMRLRPYLPLSTSTSEKNVYVIPDGCLPMSATAIKKAGKDMVISLLRAMVRIDVRIADEQKDKIMLTEAYLRNSSPVLSLFSDPLDISSQHIALRTPALSKDGSSIKGGLYATECYRTINTPKTRMNEATCLLVSCHKKSYDGKRTWYRVNVNIDKENIQYLRRNNVYTVVISGIVMQGAESPDEAFGSDMTYIKSVTIPGEWNDNGVTPPVVEIQ